MALDPLEDRCVPATFTVTNLDRDGAGSLEDAIGQANANPGADEVVFQSGLTGVINRFFALDITDPVEIQGPGADAVTIQMYASEGGASPAFRVNLAPSEQATIRGLTITGGGDTYGGGISAQGSVALYGCEIVGNSAFGGGGVSVTDGSLLIRDSTIANNSIGSGGGGGVRWTDATGGQLLIANSTISGNANGSPYNYGFGGGVRVDSTGGGSAVIANSTIADNVGSFGGGLFVRSGAVTLDSVLFAGNLATYIVPGGEVVAGATAAGSAGQAAGPTAAATGIANEIDRADGATIGANHSLFQAAPQAGQLNGTDTANLKGVDPLLGALANNGGRTRTRQLSAGSAAIGAGSNPAGLANDQRGAGFPRLTGIGVDVGAIQFAPPSEPRPPQPPLPPLCQPGDDDDTCFIRKLYVDLLCRRGTDTEIAAYVARLKAGEGRGAVLDELASSDEGLGCLIGEAYRTVLCRDPDAEGLAGYRQRLREGLSYEGLVAELLKSAEFQSLGDCSEANVTAAYQRVLGREPDAEGLAQYAALRSLAGGAILADDLAGGEEHRRRLLAALYASLLGRGLDEAALGYLCDEFLAVRRSVILSEEYAGRSR